MRRSFLLALLLASCAQPRYADEDAASTGRQASDSSPHCFRDGLCLTLSWIKVPTEEEFGAFAFRVFSGATHAPADPSPAPSVLLWMPGMGHGSSPVTVSRAGEGEYRAEKVFFSMKGAWEIRFQRREGQEVRDEIVLPYSF